MRYSVQKGGEGEERAGRRLPAPGNGIEEYGTGDDIAHDSDCAVNNAPAMEPGPCDCGALAKHERRYVAWLCQKGCKAVLRLRICIAQPLWRQSSTTETGAIRGLSRFCLSLLFGSRAVRQSLWSSPPKDTAQQPGGNRHS